MTSRPELSRRIPLRRLGVDRPETERLVVLVEADAVECAALARRLDIPAVAGLSCRFGLSGVDEDGVVEADGVLRASVTQICVTTTEAFDTVLTECFSLRFVPAELLSAQPEVELDLEADDDVPYENGVIDLGEAAVEQLALALDPYPHKPDAGRPAGLAVGDPPLAGDRLNPEQADAEADRERPNPFGMLARLRPDDIPN